jgi:hypothetical protein
MITYAYGVDSVLTISMGLGYLNITSCITWEIVCAGTGPGMGRCVNVAHASVTRWTMA